MDDLARVMRDLLRLEMLWWYSFNGPVCYLGGSMTSAACKVQEMGDQRDAAQRENVFENDDLRTNSGLQRDINIIEVQPHKLTISEMQSGVSTSEMKKALTCDQMYAHHGSPLPQAQSHPHSYYQPSTYSQPPPHPLNHVEKDHHRPVSSMLNTMCSSAMSAPDTGPLQAVRSSVSSTSVDSSMTTSSLSLPSTLQFGSKMTSDPSSTVSGKNCCLWFSKLVLVET